MAKNIALLDQLIESGPQEILLVMGCSPQVKTEFEWTPARGSPILPSEFAAVLRALPAFNEDSGEGCYCPKENLVYQFRVVQGDLVSKIHFEKRVSLSFETFQVPSLYIEALHRLNGLILVVCPNDHDRIELIAQSAAKISQKRKIHGLFVSSSSYPLTQDAAGVFSQVTHQAFKDRKRADLVMAGAEVLLMDDLHNSEELEICLQAVDNSKCVVLGVSAGSLTLGLAKVFQWIHNERFLTYRFAKAARLVMSHIPLATALSQVSSKARLYGYELVTVSREVEMLIASHDLTGLEKILTTAENAKGVQNLNQSLLQHLMKRRLDMRTAFSISQEPEEFDQLLKKVGI